MLSGSRASSSSSVVCGGAVNIAPTSVRLPSAARSYSSDVGRAGSSPFRACKAQRSFVKCWTGAPPAGMNCRKPSPCATRTSRYLASSRRMTARTSAARAESPGATGRSGVSRRCRSSATIPAMARSAAAAACSSGCCSGAAMSCSSAAAALPRQATARTYNRKAARRITRIDASAARSARAVQALEVGFLDDEVEHENGRLGEDGRDETRQRAQHQGQSVGLQVPDRVHRAREEAVRPARHRAHRFNGIEKVVPVIGLAAQGTRGPQFRAEAHDHQQRAGRDRCRARNRHGPGVARDEAQQNECERVVVHDDRGAPHEAAKTQDRTEALRVEALALLAAQHVPHEQHVRHATENGVDEDCGLRCRHVRPNKRTVAAPRRSRLRYQKSTRRTMRTGPGRSIVRLQEPWWNWTRVSGEKLWPFPNVTLMLYISRLPPMTSSLSAVNPPSRAPTKMAS